MINEFIFPFILALVVSIGIVLIFYAVILPIYTSPCISGNPKIKCIK